MPTDTDKDELRQSEPEALDFSTDLAASEFIDVPSVGAPYDPRPQEDSARRNIAYLLIGLLWVIVGGMLILVACGAIQLTDLPEFSIVLGPIVALVSAATGFYYGTKNTGGPA